MEGRGHAGPRETRTIEDDAGRGAGFDAQRDIARHSDEARRAKDVDIGTEPEMIFDKGLDARARTPHRAGRQAG